MNETDVDAMLREKTKEELEAVLKLVGRMRDIAIDNLNRAQSIKLLDPGMKICPDTCHCSCHDWDQSYKEKGV